MRAAIAAAVLMLSFLPTVARSAPGSLVRAGVGIADATWHVGTGSGQYADKNPNALGLATGDEVDPQNHGLTQQHSYGVASRLTYRALVVEGSNKKRIALVKSDSYLAQDMLTRRAAQILVADHSSIGFDQILLHVSHNHSSPYYMSPSWGVWLFQDAFEIRTFEYHARAMAHAIEAAERSMVPVRMGATTIRDTIYKGMIAGGTVTDDRTPGGYPETQRHVCPAGDANPLDCVGEGGWGDFNDTVVRFDNMTDPEHPKPLAIWMNHGQHPESLDGYDLITADYLGPLERDVFRATGEAFRGTGAQLVFSQADVGSSEGPYYRGNNEVLADGVLRAWAHVGHSQTERGAKYLADLIVRAWNNIGSGDAIVPFSTDFPVDYVTAFVPDPFSHPYPSVSNCRSESTVEGNPGSPIVGLPDCERAGTTDPNSMVWENLKEHGIPVPDNYDAPSHGAVEENLRLKLQTFRVGEVLLASCACEAQVDIILNLESRTNKVQGDMVDGFDWTPYCTQAADTTWTCSHPNVGTTKFSDARYRRMEAQIHNDAKGWDLPENVVAANSEPADPAKIWGNFTKTELSPAQGYALPVGVGHAGDYNGYTVSYREYQSRDHYRKALTCCGPHTADYMATRLMRMAASMNGGPALGPEINDAQARADEARQVAVSTALGAASQNAYDAWLASLPDDAGTAGAVSQQPSDIARFGAATVTWTGGGNAVDNPVVRVEKLGRDGEWSPFADQSGEVQTLVRFPKGAQGFADAWAGNFEWKWTASFEAFDAFPRTVVPGGQTPEGTYRFVVDGASRHARANSPYHVESAPFRVTRFDGLTAKDARIDDDGVSIANSVDYPRSYTSPFRYVHDDGDLRLCRTCSFRPWAQHGTIASVTLTVTLAGGGVTTVEATLGGGRWSAPVSLGAGDHVSIAPGGLVDEFGETNSAAIPLA
jgi:hypothetical protein